MFGIKRKPNAWERFVQRGYDSLEKHNELTLEAYRSYQDCTSDEMQRAIGEWIEKICRPADAKRCQNRTTEGNRVAMRDSINSIESIIQYADRNERYEEIASEKPDRQRCEYCGCLVSSFDAHCSSCGAPI